MPFDPDRWRLAEDVGTPTPRRRDVLRHAWSPVGLVGVALAATGLWELATGPLDVTPGVAAAPAFLRGHPYLVVALGVVVAGLAAGPLRRGERWAWALCWVVPAALVGVAAENRAVGGTLWPASAALAAVAALGLLLSVGWVLSPDRAR